MKRIILIATALLAGIGLYAQQMPPIPVDEAVRIGQLENGLTYYIRHNEEPKGQANFYIAQKVGSILENEEQRGLAHFLEHMCFNGTENFPGNSLISYLESIGVKFGAQLNAYTSIDETVYNIDNVPVVKYPTSIDSCLLILHDWAGALLLQDTEIDKERGVIHEEWRSRQNAQMRMFDKILPAVYPNNKYGVRMPIGLMEVVDNFPYDVLRSYYHTWYRPDQQGIVVVGDVDVDAVEAKIKEVFSTLPAAAPDAPERVYTQVEDNEAPIIATATDKEQPYAMTYTFLKHPAIPNEAKTTMDYAILQYVNNMVASMANARIAEMTQAADPDFMDAGIEDGDFFLSKTCGAYTGVVVYDENQMSRAVKSLYREMLRIVRNGFTAIEYERARADYMSSLESAYNQREKKDSREYCSELVRHFIDNEPIPGIENEFALMSQLAPNIPVELINQLVAEEFDIENNLVVVNMLPEKEGLVYPTDAEILDALESVKAEEIAPYEDKVSDKPLVSKLRKAGKVKSSEEALFGYKKITLSNGVNVYFKSTELNKDEVLVRAFSRGGTSLYSDSEAITLSSVSGLMEIGGLGDFSSTELTKALAGKKVGTEPYVNITEEGINGYSTPKDIETLFQLYYLYFTKLRSDDQAFASWKTKTSAALANVQAQPMTAFSDSLANVVYTNPLRARSMKYEEVEKVDYKRAMAIAKERFSNAADFNFVITGNLKEEELLPLLCKYVGSLPTKKAREHYNSVIDYKSGVNNCEFVKEMQDPMVLNFFKYNAPAVYNLKEDLTMDLLSSTLELILHEEIREKEGGTYGISASASINPEPIKKATLQIVYQTDPARYEYLNSRVEEIVKEFAVSGPRAEDIAKTKANMVKNHEENLQNNAYWSGLMQRYIRYGVDFFDGYNETLESITADDIKAALNQIIEAGNYATVVMVGEKK